MALVAHNNVQHASKLLSGKCAIAANVGSRVMGGGFSLKVSGSAIWKFAIAAHVGSRHVRWGWFQAVLSGKCAIAAHVASRVW
jgi:hypothetical protein